MSFIRAKEIKGHRYFYFCRRQRDRVADGGNGQVKAIDICLGKTLNPDSLAYYFHVGEIDAREFCQAVLRWDVETADSLLGEFPWSDLMIATLKVVQGEVAIEFRSKASGLHPMLDLRLDMRTKGVKVWAGHVRSRIKGIWGKQKRMKEWIDYAAANLWLYDSLCKELQEHRQDLALYLKDPDRRWEESVWEYVEEVDRKTEVIYEIYYEDGYGHDLDELISKSEMWADEAMTEYQGWLVLIVDYAPKKLREEFRAKVVREVDLTSRNAKKIREWEK